MRPRGTQIANRAGAAVQQRDQNSWTTLTPDIGVDLKADLRDRRNLTRGLRQIPEAATGTQTARLTIPSADPAGSIGRDQCDDSAGEPDSGWISAAIMPLEPGPNRTSTNW